jgi:hypothetical protein
METLAATFIFEAGENKSGPAGAPKRRCDEALFVSCCSKWKGTLAGN